MNLTDLNKILVEHKIWVESYRQNGSRAYLCGAYLCGADLRGADLRDADLRDADLRDANLCDANLGGANLRDANLSDANLSYANLPDRTYVIMGEKYYLQISNGESVRAGCQNHTAEEWRKFSKRDIANMDGKTALKFYPRLLDIIDFYLGKGERPEWLNEPDEEVEAA
ncbi:pentapeptide repeat-containing protein [Yersinia rohdei]|uniref:Pentapeptide repeat-containing protein n=1 Tax=Yersinia rohdei TaxID=29485 RepID=A0A0U1HRG2_YERRO|nr:pentapeptide repeat-containing protein [Yersinia rohdei]CQI88944.1 pentapeptide repeat-containing protein [Yersinia rohdei]